MLQWLCLLVNIWSISDITTAALPPANPSLRWPKYSNSSHPTPTPKPKPSASIPACPKSVIDLYDKSFSYDQAQAEVTRLQCDPCPQSTKFAHYTSVNVPANGNGLGYASACDSVWKQWSRSSNAWMSNMEFFAGSTVTNTQTSVKQLGTAPGMYTLSDGFPRIDASRGKGWTATSNMTYTVKNVHTVDMAFNCCNKVTNPVNRQINTAGSFPMPKPTCSISSNDCQALVSATGSNKDDRPSCEADPRAVAACNRIYADTVKIYYWPKLEATATPITQPVSPVTAVVNKSLTMTSPSVYLSLDSLVGQFTNGASGNFVAEHVSRDVFMPLAPESLSSVVYQLSDCTGLCPEKLTSMFSTPFAELTHNPTYFKTLAKPYDPATLTLGPVDASAYFWGKPMGADMVPTMYGYKNPANTSTGYDLATFISYPEVATRGYDLDHLMDSPVDQIIWDNYMPFIAIPEQVRSLGKDGAWLDCPMALEGIYDPPIALTPAASMAVPTMNDPPRPAVSSAFPASSVDHDLPLPTVAPLPGPNPIISNLNRPSPNGQGQSADDPGKQSETGNNGSNRSEDNNNDPQANAGKAPSPLGNPSGPPKKASPAIENNGPSFSFLPSENDASSDQSSSANEHADHPDSSAAPPNRPASAQDRPVSAQDPPAPSQEDSGSPEDPPASPQNDASSSNRPSPPQEQVASPPNEPAPLPDQPAPAPDQPAPAPDQPAHQPVPPPDQPVPPPTQPKSPPNQPASPLDQFEPSRHQGTSQDQAAPAPNQPAPPANDQELSSGQPASQNNAAAPPVRPASAENQAANHPNQPHPPHDPGRSGPSTLSEQSADSDQSPENPDAISFTVPAADSAASTGQPSAKGAASGPDNIESQSSEKSSPNASSSDTSGFVRIAPQDAASSAEDGSRPSSPSDGKPGSAQQPQDGAVNPADGASHDQSPAASNKNDNKRPNSGGSNASGLNDDAVGSTHQKAGAGGVPAPGINAQGSSNVPAGSNSQSAVAVGDSAPGPGVPPNISDGHVPNEDNSEASKNGDAPEDASQQSIENVDGTSPNPRNRAGGKQPSFQTANISTTSSAQDHVTGQTAGNSSHGDWNNLAPDPDSEVSNQPGPPSGSNGTALDTGPSQYMQMNDSGQQTQGSSKGQPGSNNANPDDGGQDSGPSTIAKAVVPGFSPSAPVTLYQVAAAKDSSGRESPDGVVADGHTLVAGQATTLSNGASIRYQTGAVVVGSRTLPLEAAIKPTTGSRPAQAVVPVGPGSSHVTMVQVPKSTNNADGTKGYDVEIGVSKLSVGGGAMTTNGEQISLGSSGVVVGSRTIPLQTEESQTSEAAVAKAVVSAGPQSSPVTLYQVRASQQVSGSSTSYNVVINGETLSAGKQQITVDGEKISMGSEGVVVGSKTVRLVGVEQTESRRRSPSASSTDRKLTSPGIVGTRGRPTSSGPTGAADAGGGQAEEEPSGASGKHSGAAALSLGRQQRLVLSLTMMVTVLVASAASAI